MTRRFQVPRDKVPTAANDNFPPAANDNFSREHRAQAMKIAVGDYLLLPSERVPLSRGQSEHGYIAALDGDKQPARMGSAAKPAGSSEAGIGGVLGEFSAAPGFEQERGKESGNAHSNQPELVNAQSRHENPIATSPETMPQDKKLEPLNEIVSKEWTRQSLAKALALGCLDFRIADLRGLDLRGIKFSVANFDGADFSGGDLRDVDFSKIVTLYGAKFDGANLSGANFSRAKLERVSFKNAILNNAIFDRATLGSGNVDMGADFSGSSLKGADFRTVENMDEVRFDRADLSGASFGGIVMAGVSFRGVKNLAAVNFDGAEYIRPDFSDSDLKGVDLSKLEATIFANFDGADLTGVDFSERVLSAATFRRAILRNAIFNGASLNQADFSQADLRGADFTALKNAPYLTKFDGADLADADFSGLQSSRTSFENAVNVQAANFAGADLVSASFSGSDLTLAKYYSNDSEVMQRLNRMECTPDMLTAMAKFIIMNPDRYSHLFEQEILRGVSKYQLVDLRLLSLARLQDHFSANSPVMQALIAMEPDKFFLHGIDLFVTEDPESNSKLVAQEVLNGAGEEQLRSGRLYALKKLSGYFESNRALFCVFLSLKRADRALCQL